MSAPVAAASGDTADEVDGASGGTTASQESQPNLGQRWSDEDWRLWNAGQSVASRSPGISSNHDL